MTLKGKVAIITGGPRQRLGISSVLAEQGASLVLAQRNPEASRRSAEGKLPTGALLLSVDIKKHSEVDEMVNATIAHFGRLDILVNNASITGMPAITSVLDSQTEAVDEIIDVNLKETFYCSRSVAIQMVAAGVSSNIVHISSVGAYTVQNSPVSTAQLRPRRFLNYGA